MQALPETSVSSSEPDQGGAVEAVGCPRSRVLFVALNYFPAPAGGAERQARLQAEELVARGHDVTVVCPRRAGTRSGSINGVSVIRLPIVDRRPFGRVSHLALLALWCMRNLRRFDLVHVHLANLQADVVVAVARALRRPTYVKVACGGEAGEVRRLGRVAFVTRWGGLRHADRVQALSAEIESEVRSVGVVPSRIVRLPNGYDPDRFHPVADPARRRELRESLGLPVDKTVLLFAGRFAAYKGIDDLLSVWDARARPSAVLVLLGTADTHYAVAPIEQSRSLLVRDWTNDVTPYMQAADVFVYPSYADGMSNALLEAMACGVAPVATKSGAAREMISDGASGLLFDARDRIALAAAIDRVVDDESLRASLAVNAARRAAQYAIPAVVDRLEAVYSEILR